MEWYRIKNKKKSVYKINIKWESKNEKENICGCDALVHIFIYLYFCFSCWILAVRIQSTNIYTRPMPINVVQALSFDMFIACCIGFGQINALQCLISFSLASFTEKIEKAKKENEEKCNHWFSFPKKRNEKKKSVTFNSNRFDFQSTHLVNRSANNTLFFYARVNRNRKQNVALSIAKNKKKK